jgi:DNA replication ATP-dependent helicase Dna2
MHHQLPQGALVAVSTAHKLAFSRGTPFDVVLLDEATQLVLPLAVAAMARGQRWVLFGDHRQMAPVILATDHEDWARRSAFEHFLGRAPHGMLETCRRMCDELVRFSSEAWYDGRVRSDAGVAGRRLRLRPAPPTDDPALARLDAALDPALPGVILRLEHAGQAQVNPVEADVVARLVARAVARGVPPEEIAVVTPYRRHEREVRGRLHALLGEAAQVVRVDTVERIQGDEREMIVVSLCDSSAGGSLTELHLNVALTRAKSKRVVLGGRRLFEARAQGGVWARVAELADRDGAAASRGA